MGKLWYYIKSIFELLFGFKNWGEVLKVFLADKKLPSLIVFLRKPDIALRVRGKMDIWSVKETFIDRFYTKYGCNIEDGWVVIDIGAAIGEFSIFTAWDHPNNRVIAYEPFRESVELFRENLDQNKLVNVMVIPKAVWKTTARINLDLSHQEPLKITSTTGSKTGSDGETISVQAISLNEVLSSNHLKKVDLIKLDCEGAEFDILLESEPDTVRAFRRIVMEYHDGQTGRHHSQLVSHLERLGYRVATRKNVVHSEIGYLFAEQIQ